MTDKIQALYYIKDLRDDNIIYVGKTIDFERRKYFHFKDKRTPIDLYLFEQGRDNFEILPFTDDDYSIKSDEELLKAEDKKILELQPLMNIRRSGLISKDMKEYQKEYQKSEKYKEYQKEYQKTEKRKEYQKEYQKTEKRKEYYREYRKSEKYKEYRREYRKQRKAKLIENI